MSRKQTLSDQLRDAIKEGPFTRYEISKKTGISEALLSRFMHGKSGLSVESIDKIGELLGLSLSGGGKPKKQTKGKGR